MTSWRYLGDCVCSLLTYIHTKQTQGSVFVHQMFPCVHQLVVCWYKAVSIRFIRALWSERWKKKKKKTSLNYIFPLRLNDPAGPLNLRVTSQPYCSSPSTAAPHLEKPCHSQLLLGGQKKRGLWCSCAHARENMVNTVTSVNEMSAVT